VEAFTESVDLMPSLLDLCGGSRPAQCDGRSLRPWLEGEVPDRWRDSVYGLLDFRDVERQRAERYFRLPHEQCAMMYLQDRHYKYVHFAGLPPALYDLERDPDELCNLAGDPGYREVQLRYAQKLLSWRMGHEYGALDGMKATPGGMVHAGRYQPD